MEQEFSGEDQYRLRADRAYLLSMAGAFTEMLQLYPALHLPEPFDIVNHAGNMWGGVAVGLTVASVYAITQGVQRGSQLRISAEQMATFKKVLVPVILAATFLVNCATETRWGVENLPFDNWLAGPTPDILDSIYSTAYAGVTSALLWQKVEE